MGLNLRNIGKKITDILGGAADYVIPGDQSYLHNGSSPQQAVQQATQQVGRVVSNPVRVAQQTVQRNIVSPFEQGASEAGKIVSPFVKPAVGLIAGAISNPGTAVSTPLTKAAVQVAAPKVNTVFQKSANAADNWANADGTPAGWAVKNLITPTVRSTGTTIAHSGEIAGGQVPKDYQSGTPLQVAGKIGTDVLNAASVLPIGAAAKGAQVGLKGGEGLGRAVVKSGLINAGFGAGYGAAGAAEQNANPGDIVKSAVTSGLAGGALGTATPIIGKGARVAFKGAQKADQAVGSPLASEAGKSNLPTGGGKGVGGETPKPTVAIKGTSDVPVVQSRPVTPEIVPAPVAPVRDTVAQQVKQRFSDSDQVILDQLKAIDKSNPVPVGSPSRVDQFMYNSNMQRGSNAVANQVLGTSDNLQAAIGGMNKQRYKNFSDYANARTELGSADRTVATSRPREQLQATVDAGHDAFGANFDALNAHYKQLADEAYKSGLISEETLARYKADNNYIRIQRDMGDLLPSSFGQGQGYSIGSTVLSQKRKGSSRDILPAGETAANYTQQVYREAAKNKTATHLLDNLRLHGLAERLDGPTAARHENVAKLIRNGQIEYYKVSPDMKEALSNINPYHMNVVTQILAAPGRVLRAGVTGLNPVFIARNLLKDQVGSGINSEHLLATHNPKTFLSGLLKATKDSVGMEHSAIYQDFLKHYGDTTSYDLTRNVQNTGKLVEQIRGGKKVAMKQAIQSPIRTAENFASITEKSTRFQNYVGTYKQAIKAGLPPEQASERAAMAAWQNSVDFGRAGTWGRAINTVIPYWNPATQGVRQMGRTLSKHPIKSTATATALVGVPLATATAWNLSDPSTAAIYNNIPEYEKDNNIVLIPPGTTQNKNGSYDVIKIPLAPGWKDAFMPIRRAMEAFAQDKPQDFGKMATDILQATTGPISVQSPGAFAGSFIPQAAKPVIQQYANQDLFSGQKIVPDYMQSATDANGNPVPENQKAYDNSSGTARAVGGVLGVSPLRVEKAFKDVAGTVGLQGLNALDTGLAKVGLIPQDQIGGQSVAQGFKKSFGSAQGIDNANKSEGAKYFDNLQTATKGLNTNEQSAFNSLHPNKKNFLGDTITELDSTYNPVARLDIYNRYPKVFAADKALDQKSRDAGKPGNPLFDLNPSQVKKVLEKDNLPPGAKDPELSNLYDQPWYADYSASKSAYFKAVKDSQQRDLAAAKSSGDTKKIASLQASVDKFNNQDNPYPVTSPDLQSAMDSYSALPKGTGARSNWIKANPNAWQAMTNQFAAIDNWQNSQRANRGLAATEGEQGKTNGYNQTANSNSGGYSKRSGGGGSNSVKYLDPYKYAVSINAGGNKVGKPKAFSVGKGKTAKVAAKTGKPKVSIKKSAV